MLVYQSVATRVQEEAKSVRTVLSSPPCLEELIAFFSVLFPLSLSTVCSCPVCWLCDYVCWCRTWEMAPNVKNGRFCICIIIFHKSELEVPLVPWTPHPKLQHSTNAKVYRSSQLLFNQQFWEKPLTLYLWKDDAWVLENPSCPTMTPPLLTPFWEQKLNKLTPLCFCCLI